MWTTRTVLFCVACGSAACRPAGEACEFADEPVSPTEAGTNGITGDDIRHAVAGSASYGAMATGSSDENEALAALAPFTLEVWSSGGDVVRRSYPDDSCGEPVGSSGIVAPMDVHLVSPDAAFDVSGTAHVYGGDPMWFGALDDSRLQGTLPEWIIDAAEARYDAVCNDTSSSAGLVYVTLHGAAEALGLSVEIDASGDCNFRGTIARVVLEPPADP